MKIGPHLCDLEKCARNVMFWVCYELHVWVRELRGVLQNNGSVVETVSGDVWMSKLDECVRLFDKGVSEIVSSVAG